MTLTNLARLFGKTPSAVGYVVGRGDGIAQQKGSTIN